MQRVRGLAAGFAVIVLAAVAFAAAAAWSWRQGKIAGLSEGPVAAFSEGQTIGAGETGGLLLFGDSRVAGWEPLPDRPYPIGVAGFAGETAIRLAPHFGAILEARRPSAVFVQMGVNDAVAASLTSGADREAALAASIRAFGLVAEQARARDLALTISLVVPPIRPGLSRRILYRDAVDAYVAALNAAIPGIARRHGARVVDPMEALQGPDGAVPEAFRADALHWTPAAYGALNRLLPSALPAPERATGAEMPA